MAAIATAGVAPQTVYATFGSKGEILHALLAQMEHDAGAESWRDRISAEVDPRRKLEAFASWSATMFSTNKAAIAAAHGAGSDPAIAEVKADADRHRREALSTSSGAGGERRPFLPYASPALRPGRAGSGFLVPFENGEGLTLLCPACHPELGPEPLAVGPQAVTLS